MILCSMKPLIMTVCLHETSYGCILRRATWRAGGREQMLNYFFGITVLLVRVWTTCNGAMNLEVGSTAGTAEAQLQLLPLSVSYLSLAKSWQHSWECFTYQSGTQSTIGTTDLEFSAISRHVRLGDTARCPRGAAASKRK
jgi:hypothetical protein